MIPPICFCRGQALFVSGLSCYDEIKTLYSTYWGFNALTGLSCYLKHTHLTSLRQAFQCPHGLELLRLEPIQRAYSKASFNALSGLSCYCDIYVCIWHKKCFNALSGLYLISTRNCLMEGSAEIIVSMPSRAYTSFLQSRCDQKYVLPGHRVSMPSRAYTSFLHIRLFMIVWQRRMGVNALSGLYLISTVPLQKPRFYAVSRACFCRYLSEYSDNSHFSCMLTFWTYLMRCTYP